MKRRYDIETIVLEFIKQNEDPVSMTTIKRHVLTKIGTVEWCMNFSEMDMQIREAVWELVKDNQLHEVHGIPTESSFALFALVE